MWRRAGVQGGRRCPVRRTGRRGIVCVGCRPEGNRDDRDRGSGSQDRAPEPGPAAGPWMTPPANPAHSHPLCSVTPAPSRSASRLCWSIGGSLRAVAARGCRLRSSHPILTGAPSAPTRSSGDAITPTLRVCTGHEPASDESSRYATPHPTRRRRGCERGTAPPTCGASCRPAGSRCRAELGTARGWLLDRRSYRPTVGSDAMILIALARLISPGSLLSHTMERPRRPLRCAPCWGDPAWRSSHRGYQQSPGGQVSFI
jgi:hypothetical protein